jgi:hypothetical protein
MHLAILLAILAAVNVTALYSYKSYQLQAQAEIRRLEAEEKTKAFFSPKPVPRPSFTDRGLR